MFHSDGKIDAGIEMLREMGVSAVHPMDPSGIDYRDFKKRYGSSLTLFGNIDITWPLVQGTPPMSSATSATTWTHSSPAAGGWRPVATAL